MMIGQSCRLLLLVGIYVTTALPSGGKLQYDGHKVFKILIQAEQELRHILNLQDEYDLDVWHMPKGLNDSMYIRVSPWHQEKFLDEMNHLGSSVDHWIHNVQELVDAENSDQQANSREKRSTNVNQFLYGYHPYQTIMQHIASYNNRVSATTGVHTYYHDIGRTHEGNTIGLIELTTSPGSSKPVIFIDGGIHAREWIAPATVLCFVDQLINNPSRDARISSLLNTFDFHLVPVMNPDGYSYSWTGERLWRKNRSPTKRRQCFGVDLNRNFPFQWDPSVGGSTSPCSDLYSGTSAGSELETQALISWLRAHQGRTKAYLTFHSFGQYWLYPWGFTSAYPADRAALDRVGQIATYHLWRKHLSYYNVGSATNLLYAAAGGSDDYAKGQLGIKYSYTVELRDTGAYGFLLPASQIQPTCEETWEGVKAMLETIKHEQHLQ